MKRTKIEDDEEKTSWCSSALARGPPGALRGTRSLIHLHDSRPSACSCCVSKPEIWDELDVLHRVAGGAPLQLEASRIDHCCQGGTTGGPNRSEPAAGGLFHLLYSGLKKLRYSSQRAHEAPAASHLPLLLLPSHVSCFADFLFPNTEANSTRGAGCAALTGGLSSGGRGGGGGLAEVMRDAGVDACWSEEAAADCRKNKKEEDGKEERRERGFKAARRGAIKEYDGNKSL